MGSQAVPVDPKPAVPRVLLARLSTTITGGVAMGVMTEPSPVGSPRWVYAWCSVGAGAWVAPNVRSL